MNPNLEEALFAAALERPAAGRAAFLDGACRGDAALRQRLDDLLAANDQPDKLLATKMEIARPTIKLDFAAPPDEAVGQTLGRYKLLEKIGEGGCGVVYVADQAEPVRRRVALKVIKLGMDTKSVVARFEAERQALAMMDHPNIAKVLDAGTTETGRPYFVMELVRGIRITDYCDQANLSTKERLDLFIKVCHAVQHAHQKGIIHRDIKPSNILVTMHDGVPVPKVIDFGIAKATEGRLTDATIYTQLNQFIGTPAYMSPEQAEMSGLDIDTRADIYSLGVLLYELLAGSTPFDVKDLMASGIDAMRKTIREKEPARPSTKFATLQGEELTNAARHRSSDVPKLVHLLKGDLDWIVMKALEKDRTRRYETASGFANDIKRHLTNEPVIARPPSAGYRLQKAWRRNRLVAGAGVAIATVLVVGAVVSLWQATRASRARHAEAEQRKLAEQNEKRALSSEADAQRAERDTRQRLYAADMIATQQALRDGNLGQAREYLRSHIPGPGQADLRGFEWRDHWNQSEGSQLHTFEGHSNTVHCVTFSPDGRWLASGGEDEQVILWDVRERTRLASFRPGGFVRAVAFHPAGDLLAVGTQTEASLWRVTDVRHPVFVTRRAAREARVAFLPNSSHMVIGQNSSIYGYGYEQSFTEIWDYERNETVRKLDNSGGRIALTADGSVLFTGVRSNLLQRWDLNSGLKSASAAFAWPLRSMSCSPDGRWLITGSGNGDPRGQNSVQLWDGVNLSPIRPLIQHEDKTDIWGVAFSPDSRLAATTHSDQLIRIWTLNSPSAPIILRGHGHEVWGASFSPDGTLLATGSADGTVRLWDVQAAAQVTVLTNVDYEHSEEGPAMSPDGKLLAIGGPGATVELWNLDSMRQVGVLTNTTHALRFSRDGRKLVTLDDTVTLKIWDLATRVPDASITLTNTTTRQKPFALSPDGTVLVGASGGFITVWNVTTRKQVSRFQAHSAYIYGLTFSPDGRRFVTGATDQVARTWNLETLKMEGEFGGQKSHVYGVAISADGRLLAAASIDGTAKVWNIASREELWTLKGHKRGVIDVAFNVDGKTLATSSDDGSVKLWNLATGREVGRWQGNSHTSWAVFSPDGGRLVIVGHPGFAQILNGPAIPSSSLTLRKSP